MKGIGEYLRKVREEKGISLKDVQETTKISMRYLEAIDRGDFNGIPGEVYRKGFIANYAGAIGLDPQDVLQRYHQIKMEQEEREREVQLERAVVEKYNPTVTLHWSREVYITIAATLIGLLLVFCFLFPTEQHKFTNLALSSKSRPEATSEAGKTNLPYPITVYAVFKDNVWISVKSDGNYLYTKDGRNFNANSAKQLWTAQKELEIRVGNLGGVLIDFNGTLLPLGEKGREGVFKFTPSGQVTP